MPTQTPEERAAGVVPGKPVPARSLFRGAREIVIEHRGTLYRLRITSNDKLILTK